MHIIDECPVIICCCMAFFVVTLAATHNSINKIRAGIYYYLGRQFITRVYGGLIHVFVLYSIVFITKTIIYAQVTFLVNAHKCYYFNA